MGTLRVTGGDLRLREGQLEDAKFQIDMKSLACEDLKDTEINRMLVRHLSSDDFFDLAKYPICKAGGIRLWEPPTVGWRLNNS
jgi:polyisoprenoid-binding protein YceI